MQDMLADESSAPVEGGVCLKRRARIMIALIVLLVLMGVNLAIGVGKLQLEKVISASMAPTLEVGDVLLGDANALPDRYDVVVIQDPENAELKLVKRIIGMPGDRIIVRDGILYINDLESYSRFVTANQIAWRDVRVDVPPGNIFVMGDNRNDSYDSLNFGPVPTDNIRSVAKLIVWPPARWRGPSSLHPENF